MVYSQVYMNQRLIQIATRLPEIAQFKFLSEIPNSHPANPIHEQLVQIHLWHFAIWSFCFMPSFCHWYIFLRNHPTTQPTPPRVTFTKASRFSTFKEENTSSRHEASTCRESLPKRHTLGNPPSQKEFPLWPFGKGLGIFVPKVCWNEPSIDGCISCGK